MWPPRRPKEALRMNALMIEYPPEVLWALGQEPEEFEAQARLLLALKLYETGKLSTGLAARVAGLPRITFMFLLAAPYRLRRNSFLKKHPVVQSRLVQASKDRRGIGAVMYSPFVSLVPMIACFVHWWAARHPVWEATELKRHRA